MSRWRDISDWMPKCGSHVIGWHTDGHGVAEYRHYDEGGWHIAAFNGQIIKKTPQLWQPMPKPPFSAGQRPEMKTKE